MDVNKGNGPHLAVAKGHAIYFAVTVKVDVGRILQKHAPPPTTSAPHAVYQLIPNIS